MIESKQQVRNSLIYLIPSIIGGLLPVITLPIFTRILTKEDYGAFALANVYALLISGIANFGLSVGYERNFFESKNIKTTAGLLYSTLVFVIVTSSLSCAVSYLFKDQIAKAIIGSQGYSSLLFFSLCACVVVNVKNYYLIYFKNTENAKALVWYSIDEIFLAVGCSLFMVAYLRIGVIGLALGRLIASTVVLVMLFMRLSKTLPFSFNWPLLKDSIKLSLPLTPSLFIKVIGNQFDKYVLRLFGSLGGVGIYSIGQRIGSLVFTIMTAMQNVFNPQIYRRMFNSGNEALSPIGKYLTPFAYLSVTVGLLISLFSEEVVYLLLPKMYYGAIPVITIMSMYYCVMFFGKVNGTQLIFMKKTHISLVLSILWVGLNILFVLIFARSFGVIGAAWGVFLASLTYAVVAFVIAQHYYRIKWEYKKMGAIFVLFLVASVSTIILRDLGTSYLIRVIFKISFLAGYVYLGVKFRVISKESYRLVRSAFTLKKAAVVGPDYL